ncbi:DUF2934 domain-containing protein [Flaviflagellibacter deserti]|jgi:hypothetical protein|uniref:DUF2934 domain-containing protein n=1 Tax=Flaviflagellibacter deserti TaxID=2267266 RepID=A0ABV9Z3B6_9HYPH
MDKEERIRLRAYEIWIQLGQPEGREREHWEQARREMCDQFRPEPDADGPLGAQKVEQKVEQPVGERLKESTELG